MGLCTTTPGVTFDFFRLYDSARSLDVAGRWINYAGSANTGAGTGGRHTSTASTAASRSRHFIGADYDLTRM